MADFPSGTDPGPITFRLKRTKKAGHTYPLKLTPHQREALLRLTRLGRTLTQKLEGAGDGAQIVPVAWNEPHTLDDETGHAAVSARNADEKRLPAVLDRLVKFFEEEHAEVFAPVSPKARKRPKKSGLSFQFEVTLLDIKTAIWRRIRVPDCTLDSLHPYIQAAFGRENCHLHQFEIGGVLCGEPDPDGDGFGPDFVDEADVLLSRPLPPSFLKARWVYEHDSGDGRRHEVLSEGFPPQDPEAKSPLCVEGKRACPPEDCGGPRGYADCLAALADPEHEQHDELLEWRGPFDPEKFDPKQATKEVRKVK
jgi:hypothetical protein